MKKCETCRHFVDILLELESGDVEFGMCRRFPPSNEDGMWPTVYLDDWCGEHKEQGE